MSSSAGNWVQTEFETTDFGDLRLKKRLFHVATQLASKFGGNISSSFNHWKEIKATYRFFSNNKVNIQTILQPHIDKTVQRAKAHNRVLLVQDTTYFNFSDRAQTQGLDIIQKNKRSKENEGLMLHNTLVISDQGLPLGLIDQHFVSRKQLHCQDESGKHSRKNVKEKESIRWIKGIAKANTMDFGDTQTIHVADRESDFYELFREAAELGENVLIRASQNRAINKTHRREPSSTYLFDYLKDKRAQGKTTLPIQVNEKGKKFRQACVSVIYDTISMPAPENKTVNKDGHLPMVELSAIMVIERNPPKDSAPLCWVLLSNLPVKTVDEALEKVNWYSLRWNIELFHKVLKSGCQVEKSQLRDAERIKKYIVLKSIIAWRLFWLSRYYLQNKTESCLSVLTHEEWSILYRKSTKSKTLPETPSSIDVAYIWIAKLGGYIGRRSDPPPGMISLWKGWQRLMDMVEDYRDICG